VVHFEWEETAGYPHPIGQRRSGRHYFCLFVLSDMLRDLAIFSNIILFCFGRHNIPTRSCTLAAIHRDCVDYGHQ